MQVPAHNGADVLWNRKIRKKCIHNESFTWLFGWHRKILYKPYIMGYHIRSKIIVRKYRAQKFRLEIFYQLSDILCDNNMSVYKLLRAAKITWHIFTPDFYLKSLNLCDSPCCQYSFMDIVFMCMLRHVVICVTKTRSKHVAFTGSTSL